MQALYRVKENNRILRVIQQWPPPKFPLAGKDLVKKGFRGETIGKVLQEIESWWISKGFKANKEQCLKKIKTK